MFPRRMDNHQPAITDPSPLPPEAEAMAGEVDDRAVAMWVMALMPDVTLDANMSLVRIDAQGQAVSAYDALTGEPHHDDGGDVYVFLGAYLRPEDVAHLRETEGASLLSASRRAADLFAGVEEIRRRGDQERFLVEFGGAGGSGGVTVPASAAAVASLEKVKYGESGGGVGCAGTSADATGCVVCIADYEVGDELSVMPCSGRHRFHRKCLTEWLARSRLCPLCRHVLPAEEQDEPSDRTTFRVAVVDIE